jgi:myo-inositol-1(or 4)-monophosphatase
VSKTETAPSLFELEAGAATAARSAGRVIREAFGGSFEVHHKGVVNLVTAVDLAAEKAIIETLEERFPNCEILAEEGGLRNAGAELQWIVDPLDGTTNFSHGHPQFGVSIACLRMGAPIVAVIYDPIRDELFSTSNERSSCLNGREIAVSKTETLDKSLLATGFPYDRRRHADRYIPAFQSFMLAGQGVRRMGAAALDLAWVACGRIDGFWEPGLQSWDVAAGVLLVERAGGRVSDYEDRPFDLMRPNQIIASNARIHSEMVEVIGQVRQDRCP